MLIIWSGIIVLWPCELKLEFWLQHACALSLGFGEDTIHASSVLVMPMMSSKLTGFRGNGLERSKILSMRSSGWGQIPLDEDASKILETSPILPESP